MYCSFGSWNLTYCTHCCAIHKNRIMKIRWHLDALYHIFTRINCLVLCTYAALEPFPECTKHIFQKLSSILQSISYIPETDKMINKLFLISFGFHLIVLSFFISYRIFNALEFKYAFGMYIFDFIFVEMFFIYFKDHIFYMFFSQNVSHIFANKFFMLFNEDCLG